MIRQDTANGMRALEGVGYALLAPWIVVHGSLVVSAISGDGATSAARIVLSPEPSIAATVVLFILPLLAVTTGVAGLHVMLGQIRMPLSLATLVVISSLCLAGSVVGSMVNERPAAPGLPTPPARTASMSPARPL